MHIKLEINAESVEEFDAAVARFAPPQVTPVREPQEWSDKIVITDRAMLGAVSIEPATKTRQRKPKDELANAAETPTASTAAETASEEPASSEPDEHPMLTPKTLAEVKALGNKKVSELGAGPIQQALIENFQVKAFGGLDPADYDRAYAILEALK